MALAWISTETGTHNGLMQRTLTGLNPPLDLLQPGDRTESSTMASTKSIVCWQLTTTNLFEKLKEVEQTNQSHNQIWVFP